MGAMLSMRPVTVAFILLGEAVLAVTRAWGGR